MKSILITGGTGFLGRRLGAKLRQQGFPVFLTGRNHDQNRIAEETSGCRVLPSDVANLSAVRDIFAETKPNIVIHAAASKYVDIAENNPMECIDVNVTGSQNVARVSIDENVDIVIGISTDKAAPPISNTYGLTKALMERMFCSMNGKTLTKFACVRFGNMPWSTGSVFPIWKRMQETEGIIRSTGPRMTRLFTPVDEAIDLVMTAVDSIEQVQGKILCRSMKAGLIKDFLEVWTSRKGGTWTEVAPRLGERTYEHLIGEPELMFTTEALLENVKHYLISPGHKADNPLSEVVSSNNSEHFSKNEIWEIISNIPGEATLSV